MNIGYIIGGTLRIAFCPVYIRSFHPESLASTRRAQRTSSASLSQFSLKDIPDHTTSTLSFLVRMRLRVARAARNCMRGLHLTAVCQPEHFYYLSRVRGY
jgi:hypothetical protein